ncbi:hypothetical protein [Rhodovulum steppense]|uniref:PH (Pleckstrin Homology) domain-containing protein n=1 Tax=Rhodovulum steppense TaxID=540251 RepID=A0A4R1YT92_9RHOB|nr:hypothetical protein [Rhodovulum steppense]TCM83490.1 hypothetical protein EV216_11334 [Rhodovulum steppense]
MFDPTLSADLEDGETVQAQFRADRGTYIKAHVLLAVIAGVGASLVLVLLGNPYPWVGIVAALLGIGVRGAYLMGEELRATWTLTDRALMGPGGRRVLFENIDKARKLGAAVQIITRSGDKHLIKFLAEPDAVVARILTAKGARR